MLLGLAHLRKACFHRRADLGGVIHAQRGLRDHRQQCGLRRLDARHVGHVLHQVNAAVELAHGALDFRVALVADHDEFVAFFVKFGHFDMHFRDQRAGGVKNLKAALARFFLHRKAHAMRAEHQRSAGRHIAQLFNEDGALVFEVIDDIGVVHDLVAYIDGRAELDDGALDDFDGPVHAGAKTARLGQQDFLRVTRFRLDAHLSNYSNHMHLKHHGLTGQRVVEVKLNRRSVRLDLLHGAGVLAHAVGGGELHHVACMVALVRVTQLVEQFAANPLDQLGVALTKSLTGRHLKGDTRALAQPQQPLLKRR